MNITLKYKFKNFMNSFKSLFYISLFLVYCPMWAQVGIGTTTPNTTAVLDIASNNSGVLFPRVALAARNAITPVATVPATGLVVYNTATAGIGINAVTPGFYYWDTIWIRFGTGTATPPPAGWQLNGNNVIPSNFLGTTNALPIRFAVNRIERFRITGNNQLVPNNLDNEILIGNATNGGENSVIIGESAEGNALEAIAIGNEAKVFSNYGISIGDEASVGAAGQTAQSGIAIGRLTEALNGQAIALGNDAKALDKNATALGFDAIADGNATAVGFSAESRGNNSVAVGLNTETNGANATAIGSLAKAFGRNATAVGEGAQAAFDNSTAIGFGAISSGRNRMRLGNVNVNRIEAQVAITTPSDSRFKFDVEENVPGLEFIKALRPVTYKFNLEKLSKFKNETETAQNTNKVETGFIAQEVEAAAKASGYDFSGINRPENLQKHHYSLAYAQFVVPLVQAVKEQQKQIEVLQKERAELLILKSEVDKLKLMTSKLKINQ